MILFIVLIVFTPVALAYDLVPKNDAFDLSNSYTIENNEIRPKMDYYDKYNSYRIIGDNIAPMNDAYDRKKQLSNIR